LRRLPGLGAALARRRAASRLARRGLLRALGPLRPGLLRSRLFGLGLLSGCHCRSPVELCRRAFSRPRRGGGTCVDRSNLSRNDAAARAALRGPRSAHATPPPRRLAPTNNSRSRLRGHPAGPASRRGAPRAAGGIKRPRPCLRGRTTGKAGPPEQDGSTGHESCPILVAPRRPWSAETSW